MGNLLFLYSMDYIRKIKENERVRVYRNLHKDLWSVQSWNGKDKGRVIQYMDEITLENCKFIVQMSGNRKVRDSGHKNVHAFVEGNIKIIDPIFPDYKHEKFEVIYNPRKYDSFMIKNFYTEIREISKAQYVKLNEDKTVTAIL